MQTISGRFTAFAKAPYRPLSWRFLAAFDKQYNSATTFFTLDTSQLDGNDILAPEDNSTITQWDKYVYRDYSSRVISIEWTREEDPFSSVVMAMADIVLDNHDGLFTADSFALPFRPVKILAGFGGETIPQFVGLTENMPVADEKNKTVSMHCIDFLSSIFNRPLVESVIYQNKRTDEIIQGLLTSSTVGLSAGQYVLDTGLNRVAFAYFQKGEKLGDAFIKLMEAEQGRLFIDELGIIRFKNRQSYNQNDIYYFDRSSIIEATVPREDDVVNVVEITSNVRTVQPVSSIMTLSSPVYVAGSSSVDVWANFNDPVISCDDPVAYGSATTSYFQVNDASDGSGTDMTGNISLTNSDLFATSFKMTFANSSALPAYITKIELFGEPAVNVVPLFVRAIDQTSIDKFDERPHPINNEFFQDENTMASRAAVLLDDYSAYGDVFDIMVKGNFALQLGDAIGVGLRKRTEYYTGNLINYGIVAHDYKITKIDNKIADGFQQRLRIKRFTRRNYFILDSSRLNDTAVVLAP